VGALGPMLSTSDRFRFLEKFANWRIAIAHHRPTGMAGCSSGRMAERPK
jgi:hypothetical protein